MERMLKNRHKPSGRKLLLAALSACTLSYLIAVHGFGETLLIPHAFAANTCGYTGLFADFLCDTRNFALSFVFTILWLFVAIFWLCFTVIPRLVFWLIYELVIGVSSLCIMLSTMLIESAVYPGEPIAQALLYNPILLDAIRTALWIPVRDLVNVGFALLLVTGAIITIIKASKETIAQYGPKFMIGIILVNFSWFIPRVVLDAANVAAVASFSFAQCTNCYTIETVGLSPFDCREGPRGINRLRTCPTFLISVDEIQVQAMENPARKAMSALFKPFQEILSLRVLPHAGEGWERLSKLFTIFNIKSPAPPGNLDQEVPPNPGYPPGWIGIGNIVKCVWVTCIDPPDPISGLINSPGPFLDAVGSLFVQAALGTLRLIILVFLAAIFLVLYVFALIAMMTMVLLRIPIIWLTMGFMPVVALAFVLGRGGIGGFLWGVWDKFVGAAFIPAALGIPVAAGSAILNVAVRLNPVLPGSAPATGIVADIFGPEGIIQIMFIIIAIIVIWLGIFAAIASLNFAGEAQKAIASRVQKIRQGAAMATGYAIASKAPILPLGTMDRALGRTIGGLTAGTGWIAQKLGAKKIGAQLREQGGKVMTRGAVGHIAVQGKQWWNEAKETKVGKTLGSIAGTTRSAIGSIFSGSALQKILVGGFMKAGTGQLDSVLGDYAKGGGDRSLADLINARLRPQGISGDNAKKAATALGKDNLRKGDDFIKAAKTLENNPADKVARQKLLEILETLKREGIPIDTSGGIPGAVRSIIDAGQADTSNPLNSRFKGINSTNLEHGLINAEKAAAASATSGSATTTPTSGGPGSGVPPPTPANIDAAAGQLSTNTTARGDIETLVQAIQTGGLTQQQMRETIEDLKTALQPHGLNASQDTDLIQAIHELSNTLEDDHSIVGGLHVQADFAKNVRTTPLTP